MRLVMADLGELDAEAAARFGGKACGLARLLACGANVPPGFALAVGAPPPARWRPAERAAFRRRAERLLGEGALAVRSSGRGEDGAERSFAGLFETVLGIGDAEAAERAVAHCLASADSERVRAYAGSSRPELGLVVQRFVAPRAAGVLFTADPQGRHRGAVLEAVAGSGDALVSGRAAPERWSVHESGRGGLEALREARAPGGAALDERLAERLTREGRLLAELLGGPLDLEWALDAGERLWWLQARPITALREAPALPRAERSCPEAREGPVTLWSNLNVRETLPDPLVPFCWSFWRDLVAPVFARITLDFPPESCVRRELRFVDRVEGRGYFNVNALLGIPFFGHVARGLLDGVDAEWSAGFRAAEHVATPRAIPAGRWMRLRASLRSGRRNLPALLRARHPERLLRAYEELAEAMRRHAREPLGRRSEAELVAEMHVAMSPRFLDVPLLFAGLLGAVVSFGIAQLAFRRHPEAKRMLGVAIAGNPTTEMSVAIEELAEAARPLAGTFLRETGTEPLLAELASMSPGRDWLARLEAFLERNGQRCPGEFDLAVPRWSEDPTLLLELVRAELREPAKEGVRERLARLAGERRAAIGRAVAAEPSWKRPWLRWAARLAERMLPLREAGKHHGLHSWQRVRSLGLELGARLAADGRLAQRDDVLFLEIGELEAAAAGALGRKALRAKVAEARARHARFIGLPAPGFLRSDGVPVQPAEAPGGAEADGTLRGTGISTGRVVGRVRVLRGPDAGALAPDEVLVVRYADPGWTPLFPRAGALVMEVGGVMCHAAVVARELGLPAVFGVRDATVRLRDGELVAVDADAGTVTPA
jgi:pyruvate,water dikinase